MPRLDQSLAVTLAILVALGATTLAILVGAVAGTAPREAGPSGLSATCLEWTDGCVVCQRSPGGLACSTPGIACVPAAPRCLREERAGQRL